MAEAKSRRESPRARTRPNPKSEFDSDNGEEDLRTGETDAPPQDGPTDGAVEPPRQEATEPRRQEATEARPQEPAGAAQAGVDEEANNRYEEHKRGRTHI